MSTLTRMHFQAQENLEQPDPVKDLTIMCNTRLYKVPAGGNKKPKLCRVKWYAIITYFYPTRVIVVL